MSFIIVGIGGTLRTGSSSEQAQAISLRAAAAAGAALSSLRSTVHALRGFPTPYGAAVVSGPGVFTESGCADAATVSGLALVGQQIAALCRNRAPCGSTTLEQRIDR